MVKTKNPDVKDAKLVHVESQSLKNAERATKRKYRLTSPKQKNLLLKFFDPEKAARLVLNEPILVEVNFRPDYPSEVVFRAEPQADDVIQLECYVKELPKVPNFVAKFKLSEKIIPHVVTMIEFAGSGEEEHEMADFFSKSNARLMRNILEAILYAEREDEGIFEKRSKGKMYLTESFLEKTSRLVVVGPRKREDGKVVSGYRYYRKPKVANA